MNLFEFIKDRCIIEVDCWNWQGALQSCGATPTINVRNPVTGKRCVMSVRRATLLEKHKDNPHFLKGKLATYSCCNSACSASSAPPPGKPRRAGATSVTLAVRSSVSKAKTAKSPWWRLRSFRPEFFPLREPSGDEKALQNQRHHAEHDEEADQALRLLLGGEAGIEWRGFG